MLKFIVPTGLVLIVLGLVTLLDSITYYWPDQYFSRQTFIKLLKEKDFVRPSELVDFEYEAVFINFAYNPNHIGIYEKEMGRESVPYPFNADPNYWSIGYSRKKNRPYFIIFHQRDLCDSFLPLGKFVETSINYRMSDLSRKAVFIKTKKHPYHHREVRKLEFCTGLAILE